MVSMGTRRAEPMASIERRLEQISSTSRGRVWWMKGCLMVRAAAIGCLQRKAAKWPTTGESGLTLADLGL